MGSGLETLITRIPNEHVIPDQLPIIMRKYTCVTQTIGLVHSVLQSSVLQPDFLYFRPECLMSLEAANAVTRNGNHR